MEIGYRKWERAIHRQVAFYPKRDDGKSNRGSKSIVDKMEGKRFQSR